MLALIFTYRSGSTPPPTPTPSYIISWSGQTVLEISWSGTTVVGIQW